MARGPAYPYIDLETAVVLSRKTYEFARRTAAPLEAVSREAWNYSTTSSSGIKVYTALKYFGLIESPDSGNSVKITDRAYRILIDDENSEARLMAVRDAALAPRWYKYCWNKWGDATPQAMRSTLIFECGFIETTVDGFIKDYKKTIEYAKNALQPIPMIESEEEDSSDDIENRKENKREELLVAEQVPKASTREYSYPARGQNMRQDVFSTTEGTVSIEWPSPMSQETFEEVSAWLEILQRKIKRSVVKAKEPEEG